MHPAKQTRAPRSGKAIASLVLGILSLFFSCFAGVPAMLFALMAWGDIRRSRGALRGGGMAFTGGLLGLLFTILTLSAIVFPIVFIARANSSRVQTSNHLKQIGLAMHNYHNVHHSFPPQGIEYPKEQGIRLDDEPVDDKPRYHLSWRVRLLPYLEQQRLYERFDFNQPWDSAHNLALAGDMPDVYRSPNRRERDNKTVFQAVVYPELVPDEDPSMVRFLGGTAFDHRRFKGHHRPGMPAVRFADILDGSTNTVMIIETKPEKAVVWTEPQDWELDLHQPRKGLSEAHQAGFPALFVDGHVDFIGKKFEDDDLRALFIRNDGVAPRRR